METEGRITLVRPGASRKLQRLNIHQETSDTPGMVGLFETFLRKFRTFSFTAFLSSIFVLGILVMGISAAPGIYVFRWIYNHTLNWPDHLHILAVGSGLFAGYALYGLSIIFVAPFFNFAFRLKLKPWRGIWFSIEALPWFMHNALTYIVRYTFLEFLTPSPLNVLFYKMMGMKIGRGVVINTTNISDPSLIELGDYVTIGGSAHLLAHYGQKGYLILSPVKIGNNTTIGLKASVMGGATVGADCSVKPHAVLLPKTTVPDGDSYE